jgi:hypothetical protein
MRDTESDFRDRARYRREHQCCILTTEVELFPHSSDEDAETLRPEARFGEFEIKAQNEKAEILGIPQLPRGERE